MLFNLHRLLIKLATNFTIVTLVYRQPGPVTFQITLILINSSTRYSG